MLRTIVKRILALVITSLFGALSIAIMYASPMSILTCRHIEPIQVDCQLQERIAWVIPVREVSITDLKEAYVKTDTQTREDEEGKEYTVYRYRVILLSASGEISLKGDDATGASARLSAKRINEYINIPTVETLTVWGYGLWMHTLVTLVGGFLFILFAFLFLATIVDMVIGRDTVDRLFRKAKEKCPRHLVWIKESVDTGDGFYQELKRKRLVILGPFLGALLGGYLLGFSFEGVGSGGVIGLCASLAAGQTKDKQGLRLRNIMLAVIGLIFVLVIARTTTVTCQRVQLSLPVTCEFTSSRLLWTTVGEFEPYDGGFRAFPSGIRRVLLAVGKGGHLKYYQYDNRAISYMVGGISILASLYLTFARKHRR